MATFENWGDYFWPGQIDECRRNLAGIHDAAQLEQFERRRTARRATELATGMVDLSQTFDLDQVKAVHRHLFQDVYEWAGELRVVDLVRPSADPNAPGHQFVSPEQIEPLAHQVFAQLGDPAALADRPVGERVEHLAQTYAGVNVLHPFVEGNGRTNRAFLDQVATAAAVRIDWSKMPHQNAVMAEAFTVGYRPVEEALAPCVTPIERPSSSSVPFLDQQRAAFPRLGGPAPDPAAGRARRGNPARGISRDQEQER